MENDFVVLLNGLPIECNKNFVQINFGQLYRSSSYSNFSGNQNQISIQIEEGNNFYEVTKNIFQGNNYEITSDNFKYLEQLSQQLQAEGLQTKLNSFCYKRECDNNQIDQHPSIQFLIEISTLIHKLTITNYEDISSQIKQKLLSQYKEPSANQNKSKKSKKTGKTKKNQGKGDNEEDDEIKEEKIISLKNIDKRALSKLFYFEIVNTLSDKFHDIEELQEHQQKIDLIIQIINELDSDSEEDEQENEIEPNTYLNNFINYIIKKYSDIKKEYSFIENHRQETFYLINYLLSNKIMTIQKLLNNPKANNENTNNLHKFWCPEYFLHFYPQEMIDKYFKDHNNLFKEENKLNESSNNNSNKQGKRKGKKVSQDKNEDKIKKYIINHKKKVKEGFCFDDDLVNMIMSDKLEEFKTYLHQKVIAKIKSNKRERKREKVTEGTIIDNYSIPREISEITCISALSSCSIIELAAFFGSRNIFKYLNDKLFKDEIKKPSHLLSYIISGQDEEIIQLYIDSIEKKKQNTPESNNNKLNNHQNNFSFSSSDIDSYSDNDDSSFLGCYGEVSNKLDEENKNASISEAINTIKELMTLCIQLHRNETYNFLNNYLLKYKEQETSNIILYEQLDRYLKKCISRSYFDFLPYLLKEGATTNVLLNLFCKSNNEIGVSYMLDFSYIDVNKEYFFTTPIEYCINNKNVKTALLLLHNEHIKLQKDEDSINVHTNEKEPLLHISCRYGLAKIVDYFLQKKLFDFNAKNSQGLRPIHLACLSGDFDTVQAIVQHGKKAVKFNGKVSAKGEYKGFTPLHFACVSGNPKIVTLLLEEYKIGINLREATKKWTPLQYAVFNGHTEVVSILLSQAGIETDMLTLEHETLLHLACISNKEEIVDLLINSPDISTTFDLNAKTLKEKTPLQIALLNGNYNMITVLLNIDVSIPRKNKKKGSKKESNIDPNMLTNNGKTPLIIACELRRTDIFNLLLKHSKIDVNIQLSTGKSALYTACELNLIDIVKTLLNWPNININTSTKLGKTPLIAACEKGNKEIVELLINSKSENSHSSKGKNKSKSSKKSNVNLVDFNAKTNDGKSALLIACEYLRMNIAEILVHIDEIECDDASDDGKTPLCYACEKGCEDLVSELLNHGVDVDHHTKDDRTPLYFACLSRNENIVQSILSKITDYSQINLKETTNGTTPLFISCMNGDLEIFKLLINEIDSDYDLNYQDNTGKSLLFASCEGENLEIIETLLTKFNVDPNTPNNEGKMPLHVACEKKNTEIVDLIVNHSPVSVDLNSKFNDATPLEIACEKGSIEIVQILLKQDQIQVNPTDKKEVPPLLCACEIWRTDIIKLLLEEVGDIDVDVAQSDGRTALHYACEKGDVGISEIILSKSDKSITSRTTDKKTPIELACKNENVEIISLLLKHISDIQINAKFFDGNTILSKACIQQSVDVVKCLLENTVIDINATNNKDKTALFIIAKNGNEQICQMLLDHDKIDINITTKQKTPLYEACKYGNAGVVELLLKKGARADCITKNGKTPLHVACQHGFNKVVSLLLNRPEVDINLLTIASPKQIETKYFKTFYSPLHIACMDQNRYSYVRPSMPNSFGSNFNRFHSYHSSNNNDDGDDDNDYNFQSSRLRLGNKQLCVELLIHQPQIDINLQTSKNETALTIACQAQNFDLIKTLLQNPQINPNVKGTYNNTALHIACQHSQVDLVQMLLNNPKTIVNCTNINDQTPLSIACDQNRVDIIKLLLTREDLIIYNSLQNNPIQKAIKNNNLELFSILLHHPSFDVNGLDKDSVTPLGYSISKQNIETTLQLLLAPNIDINKKFCISNMNIDRGNYRHFNNSNTTKPQVFSTPLSLALKLDNYQIVKMLIQSPELDVNEYTNGKTALHSSIISNNTNIASLLLSSPNIDTNLITQIDKSSITLLVGYEVRSQKNDKYLFGLNALHIACQEHNAAVVKEILSHEDLLINEYTNAEDMSVLDNLKLHLYDNYKNNVIAQNAARRIMGGFGFNDTFEKIEDTKLSVSFENEYRNECTALFIACSENQPEIVSLMLLRSDIDLNMKSTKDQLTPLHVAVKKGYLEIVNILLNDERCDATATSRDGTNILNFACQSHNIELLKMILSTRKSLLSSKNENGDTPLHYVCKSNDAKILSIFLEEVDLSDESIFDINVRNNNGDTPLHYAAKFNVPDNLYRVPKKQFMNDTNDNDDKYNYIDEYKSKTVFGILLNHGADHNASNLYGQTPLHMACESQCYNNIDILLKIPDILVDGVIEDTSIKSTPLVSLMSSALKMHYKVDNEMSDIASFGSNIRNRFNRRFQYDNFNDDAVSRCHMDIPVGLIKTVNKFLDRGANYQVLDNEGVSLLHFGIICKSSDLVEFYFKNIKEDEMKSLINHHSKYGTPIQLAVDNWSDNVMPLLCQRKKDIKFDDKISDEIIYKSALNNDPYSLLLLLLKNKDEESNQTLDFHVNYVDKENRTPLHMAVYKDNPISSCILANYPETDLTILNKDGKSALHMACMQNSSALAILTKVDLKEIQRMYEKDKSINAFTFNKFLMSHLKNLNDKVDINLPTKGMTRRDFFRRERQKELQRDPTITRFHIYYSEPQFNIGFTALHISISRRLEDVVKKILMFPTLEVNAYSEHGDTACSIAAKNWDEIIVKMLLDYPGINLNFVPKEEDDDDEYDDYGNHREKDEEKQVDPNRPAHTLTSEELYEIKQRKMNQNRTLLHSACEQGSIEITKKLLAMSEKGIFDINGVDSYDGMAPLHYICQNGNEELLNLFIEYEKKYPNRIDWNIKNKNGMTPLHFAARSRQTKIVDILINNEYVCPHVDINAVATGEFEAGRTPLSFACEKGMLEIVNLLLFDKKDDKDPFSFESKKKKVKRGSLCGARSDCDLTIKAQGAHQKGMTALHYACKASNIDVVKLILKHGGFDINARANGKSCLFLACKHNRPEIVKLLLEQNDINYNIKTPRGITPLMIAAEEGRTQIVEMLLRLRKIDKNALTVDGQSAKSMAKNQAIINLFDKFA